TEGLALQCGHPPNAQGQMPKAQARRMVEVAAFVALWMALGWALHLSAETYLALGAPLTLTFQWFVRKRPVRELWGRDGRPFRLDTAGWLIATALAVVAVLNLAGLLAHGMQWGKAAWAALALAGTVPAAYALRALDRMTVRCMATCLAIAVTIGVAIL